VLAAGAFALSVLLQGCVPAIPVSPTVQPVARGTNEWRVEPGDVIRLRTWLALDQSGDLPVNERGQVLVPTVGRITVAGLAPSVVESQIVKAYAARIDSSRVDVMILRPISVVGGVKVSGIQLADPSATVLSLISRAGGSVTVGGNIRVFLLRIGEPTREVSTADRVSDLGIRSADQLYVQDPPFIVRNAVALQTIFQGLEFISTVVSIYVFVRR
jgi:polysaccharide export outer membrane protein